MHDKTATREGQMELNEKVALLLGHRWVCFIQPELHKKTRIYYQLIEPRQVKQDWWKRQGGYLVDASDVPAAAEKIADTDEKYTSDLNACARFECIVSANGLSKVYADNLAAIVTADSFTGEILASDYDLLHASAEQRCRAFVATMEASSDPSGNVSDGASGVAEKPRDAVGEQEEDLEERRAV